MLALVHQDVAIDLPVVVCSCLIESFSPVQKKMKIIKSKRQNFYHSKSNIFDDNFSDMRMTNLLENIPFNRSILCERPPSICPPDGILINGEELTPPCPLSATGPLFQKGILQLAPCCKSASG